MDADLRGWEHRSAKLAHLPTRPARGDAEYFRRRTVQEQRAALRSDDVRVRRVHLEMALRYRALSRDAEMRRGAKLRLVP